MNTLKRYLRLYLTIFKTNISLLLTYRVNFYAGLITTLSWAALSVIALIIYSGQSSSISGWTLNELLTLSGVFSIVTGLSYSLFLRSFEELSFDIDTGNLDSALLKPLNSQFYSTTKHMSLHNLARFVAGLVILIFSLKNAHISILTILLNILLLIAAIAILYSIWMIFVTFNFYSKRLDNVISFLLEIFDNLNRTPSDTFRLASSWAFNALLPLFMVVSFPAKSFWGKLSINYTIAIFLTAMILFVIARKFWFYSLRRYESASS